MSRLGLGGSGMSASGAAAAAATAAALGRLMVAVEVRVDVAALAMGPPGSLGFELQSFTGRRARASRAKLAGDPNTSLRRSIGDGCDRLQRPFFSANFCLSVGAFSFRLPVFHFFLIALQILIEHLLRHPANDQPDH